MGSTFIGSYLHTFIPSFRSWVFTFMSSYVQGFHVHRFSRLWVLTFMGSHVHVFLLPGVLMFRGSYVHVILRSRVLTFMANSYVQGFIGSYAYVSGLLRLGVLTFRGSFVTSKGFYIQGF